MKEKSNSTEMGKRLGISYDQLEAIYDVCEELKLYDAHVSLLHDQSADQDMPIERIAKITNTSTMDVMDALLRRNLTINPQKDKFIPKYKVISAAIKISAKANIESIDIQALAKAAQVHREYILRIRRELISEGLQIPETVYKLSIAKSNKQIVLYRKQNLSNQEIADRLGVSEVVARARAQRQIKKGDVVSRIRRLSEEEKLKREEEVKIRLKRGASVSQIARDLGFDWSTINSVKKKMNKKRSKGY